MKSCPSAVAIPKALKGQVTEQKLPMRQRNTLGHDRDLRSGGLQVRIAKRLGVGAWRGTDLLGRDLAIHIFAALGVLKELQETSCTWMSSAPVRSAGRCEGDRKSVV